MSDGDDTQGLVVSEFVDDSVDPDTVGAQTGEPSAQLVTEMRVAFEFTERVQDRIRTQEVQCCERIPCGAGEKDPRHYERSRAACSART